MIAIVPVLMIIIGLLVYLVSTNPKAAEIGRLVLFSGLLSFALSYASKTINVLH